VKKTNNVSIMLATVLLVMVLVLFAIPAEAATILTGDNLTVEAGEIIDDDLYLFGETITVSGIVSGDAILFGNEVVVDGQVMAVCWYLLKMCGSMEMWPAVCGEAPILSLSTVLPVAT